MTINWRKANSPMLPWYGGFNPFHHAEPETRVEVRLRNGHLLTLPASTSEGWVYDPNNAQADIVAYRIPPKTGRDK